jgi:hypothetical protein
MKVPMERKLHKFFPELLVTGKPTGGLVRPKSWNTVFPPKENPSSEGTQNRTGLNLVERANTAQAWCRNCRATQLFKKCRIVTAVRIFITINPIPNHLNQINLILTHFFKSSVVTDHVKPVSRHNHLSHVLPMSLFPLLLYESKSWKSTIL